MCVDKMFRFNMKNPQFHTMDVVEKELIRQRLTRGLISQKSGEKIYSYLELLEKTHGRATASERAKDRLRS